MRKRRSESEGFIPHRRRWWQLESIPATADDEARELEVLSRKLQGVGERARKIADGMGRGLLSSSVDSIGRRLEKIGRRWDNRASRAMKDALAAHNNDREWLDEHDRVTREDWAVNLLAYAAKDPERAANTLYDDAETAAQIKALVEQLDAIYWRLHERDSKRRWRRFHANGSDLTIPLA